MAKPDSTDKFIDDLIRGKKPEEILGDEGVLKQLTKRLVERALEGEMTHHLGYEPHAPEGKNTGNSRNGKTVKTVIGESGELEITVPRDRTGEFEPKLLPKRQRRLPGFDDKVIALYARGMTTREIQGHLEELYGVEVSPQLISAVTDSVMDDVAAWQSRPLDPVYPIVYLDALHLKMRHEGRVQNQAVYLALGITLEGRKELLGLWIGENEGAKFWLSVMTELKNRGVQDILIACVDGLKGFPEAIESIYPKTQVQLCIIHMVRHSLKYVGWKERKAVAADLRAVYTAATAEAAEHALDAFEKKWAPRFPSIVKSWRTNWLNVIPFFSYPPEIRKVIYTTNAIESIQSSLRKMTRQRGAFPNQDSVRKVIYLALSRISKKWKRPVLDWVAALNHFSVVFEGRI
ncbi:MAG TPA: IS256 family transposase [Candidatus Krumholzibacteria bacterium]|nr:IS256 family transposase [Candidatus Krumholzibacteria bacterium]